MGRFRLKTRGNSWDGNDFEATFKDLEADFGSGGDRGDTIGLKREKCCFCLERSLSKIILSS